MIKKEEKTFALRTFGCQMNVNDSQKVAGMLQAAGWRHADDASQADLVFVNTCAVRDKAESKLYSEIGRLHSRCPSGPRQRRRLVAVGGCVAQLRGQALLDRGLAIDVVVGPRSLHRMPDLVEAAAGSAPHAPQLALDLPGQEAFKAPAASTPSSRARALVTVMEGCNQVCSFCVVPRARGTEVFRPVADVVAEAKHWVDCGVPEVLLLGQTVNAYSVAGVDFASLLRQVASVEGLRRLRFATSHPRYLTTPLIDAFATIPNLCPHLHLPVQSGSDRVLAGMRRGYDRAQYVEGISALRSRNPDIALWTDVIVGYPRESDEDFDQTLNLIEKMMFDGLFAFTYSPRPGTVAFRSADDVSPEVKRERLARLNRLQQSIQQQKNTRRIGGRESVLFERLGRDGQLEGRTLHNRVIHCVGPANLIGHICEVDVTSAGPNSLVGCLAGKALPSRG